MIELLLVIVVIAILGTVALPQFLDFRREARIAAAQKYSTSLQAAITAQKAQMMLKCGQPLSAWPRKEAIELNDITENGALDAHCTTTQIPNIADRKFLDQDELLPPLNPTNTRLDIVYTSCSDLCSCPDEGGYLYNASTGTFGHSGILDECRGIAASSTSTSTSTSDSSSTSSSSNSAPSSNSSSSLESSAQGFSEDACPGTYTGINRYDLIAGQCYSAGICDATGQEVHPGYPGTPNSYEDCVSSSTSSNNSSSVVSSSSSCASLESITNCSSPNLGTNNGCVENNCGDDFYCGCVRSGGVGLYTCVTTPPPCDGNYLGVCGSVCTANSGQATSSGCVNSSGDYICN